MDWVVYRASVCCLMVALVSGGSIHHGGGILTRETRGSLDAEANNTNSEAHAHGPGAEAHVGNNTAEAHAGGVGEGSAEAHVGGGTGGAGGSTGHASSGGSGGEGGSGGSGGTAGHAGSGGSGGHTSSEGNSNSSNCYTYNATELDTSQCPRPMRHNDHGSFTDILRLMEDAEKQEDCLEFIVYSLIRMYMYIHCASDLEAIAVLFYDIPGYAFAAHAKDQVDWMTHALTLLQTTAAPSSGTPGLCASYPIYNHSDQTDNLMQHVVIKIIKETHVSCVQWILDKFRANATSEFKNIFPNFPDPNKVISYTTTQTTTTKPSPAPTTKPSTKPTTAKPTAAPTTAKPTTAPTTAKPTAAPTTAKPTTAPTTAKPTTAPTTTTPKAAPLTIKPSTKPTTTSPSASSTATNIIKVNECHQCSGLACLLHLSSPVRCSDDKPLCYTSLKEGMHGREILRGCEKVAECDSFQNIPSCENAEDDSLSWNTECKYCCNSDGCNVPPSLKPADALWHPRY